MALHSRSWGPKPLRLETQQDWQQRDFEACSALAARSSFSDNPDPDTCSDAATDSKSCKHQALQNDTKEPVLHDRLSFPPSNSTSTLNQGEYECLHGLPDTKAVSRISPDYPHMQDISPTAVYSDASFQFSRSAPSSYRIPAEISQIGVGLLQADEPPSLDASNASSNETALDDTPVEHCSEEQDSVPPLHAASSKSPSVNPVPDPPVGISESNISPTMASSPIPFTPLRTPGSIPSPRPGHAPRSSSFQMDRVGSARRQGRRASARSGRSGSVAQSPASSWLSMWSREENVTATQSDDDGQSIGQNNEYVLGRQVGFGGFSIVKEATTFENGEPVVRAVKIVRKHVDGHDDLENDKFQLELQHEISIWKQLKHTNILRLIDEYTNSFATFCFTQMTSGGTLFDHVRRHRQMSSSSVQENVLTSNESSGMVAFRETGVPLKLSRRYLHQLASALRYLHRDMHMVHRDVKLENCLLNFPCGELGHEDEGNVLLCDFGMTDHISPDLRDEAYHASQGQIWEGCDDMCSPVDIGPSATSTSITGSLQYASPELIRAGRPIFEPFVDMWAFGVVSHALLTAELPFTHHFMPILQTMILKGEWNVNALVKTVNEKYPEVDSRDASSAADLTLKCLEMDTSRRWTTDDVLNSPFLLGKPAEGKELLSQL